MIRLIFTTDIQVRDSLIRILSLQKKEQGGAHGIALYQKNEWLLTFSETHSFAFLCDILLELYIPDRVYLPYFGRSIDLIHQRGDVIIPNVFFSYNPKLEKEYITKEERDNFDASPLFLEIFHEQKDYFVENYGLSIGGILVEKVPEIGDNADKLMFAYEGDVYVKEEVKSSVKLLQTYIIPIVIAVGITEGKSSPHEKGDISDTAIANIVTTWRLMEEDE